MFCPFPVVTLAFEASKKSGWKIGAQHENLRRALRGHVGVGGLDTGWGEVKKNRHVFVGSEGINWLHVLSFP